jgi:hypothetical protein
MAARVWLANPSRIFTTRPLPNSGFVMFTLADTLGHFFVLAGANRGLTARLNFSRERVPARQGFMRFLNTRSLLSRLRLSTGPLMLALGA